MQGVPKLIARILGDDRRVLCKHRSPSNPLSKLNFLSNSGCFPGNTVKMLFRHLHFYCKSAMKWMRTWFWKKQRCSSVWKWINDRELKNCIKRVLKDTSPVRRPCNACWFAQCCSLQESFLNFSNVHFLLFNLKRIICRVVGEIIERFSHRRTRLCKRYFQCSL